MGIPPPIVYETFTTISEMKLSNQQEMSWRWRLWSSYVWEKGQPKLFDMHAMGDLMLQHTGWLQISYISLYFDHFLFFFRSMFSFYSAPLNPISSLRFCKNTAGSVFSFYLLFTSFHASCLMVSLHLREDTFFWIGCIIFVMPCCIISGLSPATR